MLYTKELLVESLKLQHKKMLMSYDTKYEGRGSEVFNFQFTNHVDDFLNNDRVPLNEDDIETLINHGVLRKEMYDIEEVDKVYCFCIGI